MGERLEVLFPGGKRVDAKIREFEIATDQAIKAGGGAHAPEPFDLFLASMATCAGIYALNFCQVRSLPTDGLKLSMEWERAGAGTGAGTQVRYRLTLPQGFPTKYRAGILRAMDLCAVKQHILSPPEFATEIAG